MLAITVITVGIAIIYTVDLRHRPIRWATTLGAELLLTKLGLLPT